MSPNAAALDLRATSKDASATAPPALVVGTVWEVDGHHGPWRFEVVGKAKGQIRIRHLDGDDAGREVVCDPPPVGLAIVQVTS